MWKLNKAARAGVLERGAVRGLSLIQSLQTLLLPSPGVKRYLQGQPYTLDSIFGLFILRLIIFFLLPSLQN
jgi:hypothetical protein